MSLPFCKDIYKSPSFSSSDSYFEFFLSKEPTAGKVLRSSMILNAEDFWNKRISFAEFAFGSKDEKFFIYFFGSSYLSNNSLSKVVYSFMF